MPGSYIDSVHRDDPQVEERNIFESSHDFFEMRRKIEKSDFFRPPSTHALIRAFVETTAISAK